MANSNPNKTTLKKGDNLPPRGKAKKTLMLDAIRSVCGDERDFLEQVVTIGLGGWTQPEQTEEQKENKEQPESIFQNPNPMLLSMVINRIEPPLKAISPMVEFDFNTNDKPHVKADKILQAVSDGKIPPDIGQMFVSSIKSMIDISEWTDLKERIEKLEELLNK